MNAEVFIAARSEQSFTNEELYYHYRKAVANGVLEVMSRMGISTLQSSYKKALKYSRRSDLITR